MSDIDTSKLPQGGKGFAHDFAADQTTFKGVPWGKAMMWILAYSDGTNSLKDIEVKSNIDFKTLIQISNLLCDHKLIEELK